MAWHDASATSAYSPGVGAAPLPPNGSGMSTATVRSPTRASTAKSLPSSPCAATCRPAAAGLSVSASAVASIFDFSSVVMVPPWGCRLQGASASTIPETFLGLRGKRLCRCPPALRRPRARQGESAYDPEAAPHSAVGVLHRSADESAVLARNNCGRAAAEPSIYRSWQFVALRWTASPSPVIGDPSGSLKQLKRDTSGRGMISGSAHG